MRCGPIGVKELMAKTNLSTNFIAHVLACLSVLPSPGYKCDALDGYDLAELLEREFRCSLPSQAAPSSPCSSRYPRTSRATR